MFIKEIHQEDRERAIGQCINARAYRIFSRAAEMLSDKGLINSQTGEIAVCICSNFATLPREVDTPLAIQVDSQPTIARNEWYTYHINGTGDQGFTPCGYSDILGSNFCTAREPDRPVNLALRLRSAQDANKKFMVHAYAENGERIYSPDSSGQMRDGFLMPTVFGALRSPADIPPVVKIDYISKDVFTDWCELYAVDPDTNEAISLLGKYAPDEVAPRYIRVRVAGKNVARIKFKRRSLDLLTEDDWVPVDHKAAFLMACKSIVKLDSENFEAARWCEAEAERMIKERERSRRPGGISPPQVIVSATNRQSSGLHY